MQSNTHEPRSTIGFIPLDTCKAAVFALSLASIPDACTASIPCNESNLGVESPIQSIVRYHAPELLLSAQRIRNRPQESLMTTHHHLLTTLFARNRFPTNHHISSNHEQSITHLRQTVQANHSENAIRTTTASVTDLPERALQRGGFAHHGPRPVSGRTSRTATQRSSASYHRKQTPFASSTIRSGQSEYCDAPVERPDCRTYHYAVRRIAGVIA